MIGGSLAALLLMAQFAPAPTKAPLVEPFKNMLPNFNLTVDKTTKIQEDMTERVIATREPFLSSDQATKGPDTLGLFLGRGEYTRMRGNLFFGYWSVSPGFLWKPEWKTVAFTAPRGVHRTSKMINPLAWDKAMEIYAAQNGLKVGPSPIRITGAVVQAVTDPANRGYRGYVTTCEWRIQSPTGQLVYRFSIMKPTIGAAISGNLAWVLGFAHGIDGISKHYGRFVIPGTAKGLNSGS